VAAGRQETEESFIKMEILKNFICSIGNVLMPTKSLRRKINVLIKDRKDEERVGDLIFQVK
jgi:hypothetical protein